MANSPVDKSKKFIDDGMTLITELSSEKHLKKYKISITHDFSILYKEIQPTNFKNLSNDITQYPFVEIRWYDIEGDSGWSDTKTLKNSKLPIGVPKGYLLNQSNGITKIFTDYIESKEKPTFDNIGNTTIIPTSVIVEIKKIKL